MPKSRFDELLEFPSLVDFRIIVTTQSVDALEQIYTMIAQIQGKEFQGQPSAMRPSKNGTYISYTLPIVVDDANQLDRLYSQLSTLSCVMHVL